jgi:hypothetical protein
MASTDKYTGAEFVKEARCVPLGGGAVAVTASAQLLSALISIPAGAQWAWLQPQGGDVYVTELSTQTPDLVGAALCITDGTIYPLQAGLTGVKLIAAVATTASVQFFA